MKIYPAASCIVVIVLAAAGFGEPSLASGPTASPEPVIQITAKRYEFVPHVITLKKGVPVVLEIQSPEVTMSFNAPDFMISEELPPGKMVRVRLVPDKVGEFPFVCDIYCGSGHETMTGTIKVVDQ